MNGRNQLGKKAAIIYPPSMGFRDGRNDLESEPVPRPSFTRTALATYKKARASVF